MSNMPYCRFKNAYRDLFDCCDYMIDDGLSEEEKKYKRLLLLLCRDIADTYDGEID